MILSTITLVLAILGTLLSVLAAVGVLVMPDLFTRMQAGSKSSTLGVACILLAAGLHFSESGVLVRAGLGILFVFLTAPVAAHMIARAAYRAGVPLAPETVMDEWRSLEEPGRRPSTEAVGPEAGGRPGEDLEAKRVAEPGESGNADR